MAHRRSAEEIAQVLEQYRASGLTQLEFCQQTGIKLSTLGRYVRRDKTAEQAQQLVRVGLEAPAEPGAGSTDSSRGKRLMFGLGPATKIYIAVESVDMRKGFDGLYGLVRDRLGQDPLSGHLFLFANRARTRLKVLVWDGSGLWVCAKRLEKGRFRWPAATEGNCLVMRPEELALLLNGLDLAEARPRKNWLRRRLRRRTFSSSYVRKILSMFLRLTYNRTSPLCSLIPRPASHPSNASWRGRTMDSLDVVRRLVAHGAKVNGRTTRSRNIGLTSLNTEGATPFLLACRTADVELMRLLLSLGADSTIPNVEKTTPLMVAAGVGTRSPGEDAGAEPEALAAVKLLIELGADINTVDDRGETAIHGVAYKHFPSVAQFLVDHGAGVAVWNTKNRNRWTPLRIAVGVHRGMNLRRSPETEAVLRSAMTAAGVSTVVEPEAVISGAIK